MGVEIKKKEKKMKNQKKKKKNQKQIKRNKKRIFLFFSPLVSLPFSKHPYPFITNIVYKKKKKDLSQRCTCCTSVIGGGLFFLFFFFLFSEKMSVEPVMCESVYQACGGGLVEKVRDFVRARPGIVNEGDSVSNFFFLHFFLGCLVLIYILFYIFFFFFFFFSLSVKTLLFIMLQKVEKLTL